MKKNYQTHKKECTVALVFLLFLLCFVNNNSSAQSGQIEITRVAQMPNMPTPYIMRNWKSVAIKYDSFIYNLNATGQYLPVMHLKSSGTNYPSLQPILLDSYVGINGGGTEAEAINIIPSVVSASLVGIDKSNQFGNNWVLKTKDFFNKANGQNVYLNSYSGASGSDWWYDLMPNVFFYQLYSLYPNTQDFNTQFTTVADQWLAAVYAMGGSTTPWKIPQMNYRAFNLATMTPNSSSVAEPEGAGTIGWLLYHAYKQTGKKKYLEGAQMAISYLSGINFNPAYEIELPYGTLIAAKMNAELGTKYNIQKMINWSFDQSSERNWGTVVGTWGNSVTGLNNVSGLVGEIDNPSTGYAFTMNGYEQAAALVPLVKYDKRFARTVSKWVLNLANASRLFYSQYLPASHQDSYLWSNAHDPNSVISYEALKQTGLNDSLLYATGDAIRTGGGQTNLGLYGASHVGYLASLLQTTDVAGILLLDVNKTDFFGQNAFPSYIIYNPYASNQQVTLPLGSSTYDIYDAIAQTKIATGATGNSQITVPANQAMLLVYLPAGATTVPLNGKLMSGNKIVDYSYGYNFNGNLLIQSLASADSLVQFNQQVPVYSSVRNNAAAVTYNWYVNGTLALSTPDSLFTWSVPTIAGAYKLLLSATDGTSTVKDSLKFSVVAHIPVPPVITGFSQDTTWYYVDGTATITCHAHNASEGNLKYSWSVPGGSITSQTDSVLRWKVPQTDGLYSIIGTVKNSDSLSVSSTQQLLVKKMTQFVGGPVAYYPMNGDVKDYSGNSHNAVATGVQLTADSRGEPNMAYKFSGGNSLVDVPNASSLNFQNQITLSFWLELDQVPAESYVLSHGSYQERWKISIVPNNKIRWTVNSSNSITDLDSSFPLQLNKFYHFTAVYTGYSMELYVNGVLNSFIADTGLINVASDDVTFGQETSSVSKYNLFGTLDEVRIYSSALGPNEIITLKTLWNSNSVTSVQETPDQSITVYPNPPSGVINVNGISQSVSTVSFIDMTGRSLNVSSFNQDTDGLLKIYYTSTSTGVLILKIETTTGVIFKKLLVY